MVAPLRTAPSTTHGKENWIFIPSIASAALAATVAEATAASALDITDLAFSGATPEVTANTERVRQERRAGDTSSFENIGETAYEGGEVSIAWRPQDDEGEDGKKAWEKFPVGTTGFFAKREGVAKNADIVAGQHFTYVMPIELGPPIPGKTGEGSAGQSSFRSTFAITGEPQFDVVVLA